MVKVAINGLGKIGRATLKALLENSDLELVAVNDIEPAHTLVYLLNFDSVYGKSQKWVTTDGFNLFIGNKRIRIFNIATPSYLPWRDLGVDVVFECTGKHSNREDLQKHLEAGAKHVVLSAPSLQNDVATVISGVNKPEQPSEVEIISSGGCAANCVAPILEIMKRRIGVKKAMVTTLNSLNGSQPTTDKASQDPRAGRSGATNFIPSISQVASTASKVLPELKDKICSMAIQAPVSIGSFAEVTLVMERNTSVDEINWIFSQESGSERYIGIVAVNTEPIVSSDIMMDPRASVVDLTLTQVVDGDLVRIVSWYDNEWGIVNQMIREARRISLIEVSKLELELAL